MKQHTLTGATERLFDTDPYLTDFTADVISCEELKTDKYCVILDKTAFFPEGGGQSGDMGILRISDSQITANVLDTQEKNGEIQHITDAPLPLGKVTGAIDFPLRYERMRNHSGEHLLSGFAHRLFGCTNVGFHLNDETVTVDFDKPLTHAQLMEIEESVNRIIAENVRITAFYPVPEQLADLDYRSKLELTENVRIVEIGTDGQYDCCACCAPHVASTAEIGMLLITDAINYKGGTRLTMVCGKNAYISARTALTNARTIATKLSAKVHETSEAFDQFIRRTDEDKARNSALTAAYIDLRLTTIAPTDGNIVLFEPDLDRNALRRLVDKAADRCGICAGFTGSDETGWTYIMISRTTDLKAAAKSLNEKISGKGGGSPQMIQGTALAPRKVLETIFE